jgi:hypothetical protein
MGYLGLFLKDLRTDEAKFFNHFGMSVDSWRTVSNIWLFCTTKKKTHKYEKTYTNQDRSAVTQVITVLQLTTFINCSHYNLG